MRSIGKDRHTMPLTRLGKSVAQPELHIRMASPNALDVFSSPALTSSPSSHPPGDSVRGSQQQRNHDNNIARNLAPTTTNNGGETDERASHVFELRRQRDDDLMTQQVLQGEHLRRLAADEELRAARVAAEHKVAAMQSEIFSSLQGEGATLHNGLPATLSTRPPSTDARTSDAHRHAMTPSSASHASHGTVPASPLPLPPASPSSSRRPPSQSQRHRPIDASTKLHYGPRAPVAPFLAPTSATTVRGGVGGAALKPVPASPATESLTQWLPNIPHVSMMSASTPTRDHRMGTSSPRGLPRATTRGGGTRSAQASRAKSSAKGTYAVKTPSAAAMRRQQFEDEYDDAGHLQLLDVTGAPKVGDDDRGADVASQRWMPQSFLSSHFVSIVKWAEMSYGEALVAHAAASSSAKGSELGEDQANGDDEGAKTSWYTTYRMQDDAQPSSLLTTAYCAIIDELLWNLPGFQHIWEGMRGEIFSSIFRLKKRDLVGVVGDQRRCHDGNGVEPSPPLSLNKATDDQRRLKWFSRVCGRRDTWFDTACTHLAKSHELQESIDNIHVSLEKYDLIFDIYDRTADRQITERAFRAWKTTTFRSREHNHVLQQVFKRLHKRSPVLVAFHGWRRVVFQRKLRSSKDKDATLSAVTDARMKAKADELDRLQRQLEQETLRLRNNAEREARKSAAMITNHEVEMRELHACQDAKDNVIISLEKIAKRWERLAKTCRPLLFRAPLPNSVLQVARGLHDVETELTVKGPSPARLLKGREALDKILCTWVNHVLDTIGSKAMRIKNTTSDVRDGEALMAICKYIISRSSNSGVGSGGGASYSVGGGGGGGNSSASGNWSTIYNAVHANALPDIAQPFLSPARGGATLEDAALPPPPPSLPLEKARITSPQPTRTISPQAKRGSVAPQRGRGHSVASIAVQLQQESQQKAVHQVQSLHATVVKALYLGTAEGLNPLLLSSCPFAARIIGREEEFFVSPHPTAGAWILASLFVCEMLQTFAQIADPSDVRFGCPAEVHFATQIPEFSLMLACDRTGNVATATSVAAAQAAAAVVAYVPQKKEQARESIKMAPLYQDGRAGKLARDRAGGRKGPQKGKNGGRVESAADEEPPMIIEDTASDVEAYLGKDEEQRRGTLFEFDHDTHNINTNPMDVGNDEVPVFGGEGESNQLCYVTSSSAVSSESSDDDVNTNVFDSRGGTTEAKTLSPPPIPGLVDRKGSKPFSSFRRVPSSVATTAIAAATASTTSPPLSHTTTMLSPGSSPALSPQHSRRGTTVSIQEFVNDENQRPAPHHVPGASSTSPTPGSQLTAASLEQQLQQRKSDLASYDSTISMTVGNGAVARRAISPVRGDLQSLPMHTLFRKLRRETRQKEEWLGLARLVTSVVLRYRILDVDAPHKIRVSVAPLPDVEPVVHPVPELVRRSASITRPPAPPPPPKVAQPTAVPRSAPSSGTASPGSVPLSRQSSTRHHSRGGSIFFSPDAGSASDDAGSSKGGSQAFSPLANDSAQSAAQRRSIVKFE